MSSQDLYLPPACLPPVAERRRRRPRGRLIAASIMALVLLGGCGTQRTPNSYTSGVEKNFLKSCEAESKDGISNAKQTCACSYSTIKKSIPFSRFKKLNSELAEKPGPLPAELLTIVSGCKANETAAASSTTTTKPGTTTTR